ncbi:hypothetical protein GcC1_020026 [Golovinomyces cichoracearum]|uniref:Secreted effector protein n=1 Tax=Golovinomyces cichoracearum TaxID=62708 RepID=A0A420J579_9PEZI|nr:hypothetical protein GcC1_020026 [Golovinomyces cichoracearum]
MVPLHLKRFLIFMSLLISSAFGDADQGAWDCGSRSRISGSIKFSSCFVNLAYKKSCNYLLTRGIRNKGDLADRKKPIPEISDEVFEFPASGKVDTINEIRRYPETRLTRYLIKKPGFFDKRTFYVVFELHNKNPRCGELKVKYSLKHETDMNDCQRTKSV